MKENKYNDNNHYNYRAVLLENILVDISTERLLVLVTNNVVITVCVYSV